MDTSTSKEKMMTNEKKVDIGGVSKDRYEARTGARLPEGVWEVIAEKCQPDCREATCKIIDAYLES